MAVIEACVRCVPGVLGNDESAPRRVLQSGEVGGLLEYPQYTRPAEFRGMTVPAPLVSGHHAEIERWREEQALERTDARDARTLLRRARGNELSQGDRVEEESVRRGKRTP